MPKKLCGSVRCSWHGKDGVPKELCGSVRWSRRRKDGAPKKLVVEWDSLAQERWCA